MAGYASRQATYTDGDTILAAHSNSEFNQLLAAFNSSTGHKHGGTAGEGSNVVLIVDNDSDTKVTVENSADEDTIRFFTGAGGQQFAISDGKIEPTVNNDVDLGSNSFKFKNLYIAGTSTLAGVVLTGTLDLDGQKLILDGDGDTSITADTDDQIDIEIAGADDFRFTANTFTALSGSTISVPSGATLDVSAGTLTLANDQISGDKINGGTISGPVTIVSPVITTSPTAAGSTWTDLGTVTTADINGGTIDGVTIGGTTPGAVTTSSLVATTADINGGTIDGVTIGVSSVATQITVDNLRLDGGTLSTTTGDLTINPVSTARIVFDTTRASDIATFINRSATTPGGFEIAFTGAAPDNNTQTFITSSDTGAQRFRVDSDGDVKNHDNSYGAISDERLKQDIEDANLQNQWDDIKNVRVRKYKFKSDVAAYGKDAPKHIGVVSQELKLTSPGLVGEDANGIQDVQYSVLYMKAVGALQLALTRIETLEARLEALENA